MLLDVAEFFPRNMAPTLEKLTSLSLPIKRRILLCGDYASYGTLIGTDFPIKMKVILILFCLFTIEWNLSTIKWYVDDVLIQTVVRTSSSVLDDNWPFDSEFHLILNTAVGGT